MPDPLTNDDFRNRYSAETAGMPANLAAVASQNLAAQDAATAKVNAAARLNPLPTPGTTYATPETDAQNYGISDAMDNSSGAGSTAQLPSITDTHISDIADRRSQIADQKKDIMAKLGVIPPSAAGYSAIVLAPPKQQAQLLQTWHLLDAEDNNLLREHHDTATLAAHDAHEQFSRQTHIQAATDFASMANDLAALHQTAKPGTPEFEAGALKIAANHPYGFGSTAGQTLFRGVSATHDKALTAAGAADALTTPASEYYSPEALLNENPGARYRQNLKTGGFVVTEGNPASAGGGAKKPPPAALVKQAAELADFQATKNAAYNANPKADLSSHDRKISVAQAKLDAMKDVLGYNTEPPTDAPAAPAAPAAAVTTTTAPSITPQDQAAIAWANANPKDPRAAAIKRLHGLE